MDKETRELLAKLFTAQLKQLAEEKGIDCGEDPDRIDYLSTLGKSDLISKEDVERFIDAKEVEEEVEHKEEEYLGEIENIIKEFKSEGNIFNKANGLLQKMQGSFDNGNLEGTISAGVSSPGIIDDTVKNYENVRRAFVIYAFKQLINDVQKSGIDIGEAETLVSKATKLFHKGDNQELDGVLKDIAEKAVYLNKEQAKKMKDMIYSVEEFIDQARDLGAEVKEARDFFHKAEEAFDSKMYNKVEIFLTKAKKAAEEARKDRIHGLSDSLLFVRTILNDSKEIGADVSEAESIYDEAQSAFQKENYRECKALVKEVEQVALELQDAQIQKAMKLRRRREPEEEAIGGAGVVVEVEPEAVSQPRRRVMRAYRPADMTSPGSSRAVPSPQRMRKTRCPNCGQSFPVKGGKGPTRIECPFCGMRGMMP